MTIPNIPLEVTTEKSFYKIVKSWIIASANETKRIILEEPITRYIIYITLTITLLILIEASYDNFVAKFFDWGPFITKADKELIKNFVEWFGVLYGFLLPQILVRVWQQFDEIDNVFDSEADAIKILAEDLLLLRNEFNISRTEILKTLLAYSKHVLDHNAEEVKLAELPSGNDEMSKMDIGAQYLKDVREKYKEIIHQADHTTPEVTSLVTELLHGLNLIIDLRGDRISLSSERLYDTLRLLAIITSIVWLVPFYFLYYTEGSLGAFGWLLVIAVTFLVIMILTIIDDLDDPFTGYWTINKNSWIKLVADIEVMLEKGEASGVEEKTTQTNQPANIDEMHQKSESKSTEEKLRQIQQESNKERRKRKRAKQ